jgi:membrane protease YdiL (CAAX protease family)
LGEIARQLGLDRCPPFYRDVLFFIVLLAGGLFWLGLWLFSHVRPLGVREIWSWAFLSLVLWHPVFEELLFRGFLQGLLGRQSWGQWASGGMTVANGITTLLFMTGHWWSHSPRWALAVIIPSLVFGYLRDRYGSVYPSIAVHAFYNTGYFYLTGIPIASGLNL